MLNLGVGLFCLSCLGLYASCTWISVYCFRLGKFSVIILLNAFFFYFLLYLVFWDPYDVDIGMLDVIPKITYSVSIFSIRFSFHCFLWVIFIILPSTSLMNFLYLVCCSFLPMCFSFVLLYSSDLTGSFLYFLVLC